MLNLVYFRNSEKWLRSELYDII